MLILVSPTGLQNFMLFKNMKKLVCFYMFWVSIRSVFDKSWVFIGSISLNVGSIKMIDDTVICVVFVHQVQTDQTYQPWPDPPDLVKDQPKSFIIWSIYLSFCNIRKINQNFQVHDDRRKSIEVERGGGMVVTQYYLKRTINSREFELCSECPATQSQAQSKYRISCAKHNK